MKVGLLIFDQVKEAYIADSGTYPEMFQTLFPAYEFEFYEVFKGEFPESVADCEVYMTTGSSHSVYENLKWIQQAKAFIREIYETNRYFIGFCFGHQLMAEALGGKVGKAEGGWCVGIHEFEVVHIKHWMRPVKTEVNFLMMCQDQVLELPPNTIRLAGSKACPNAMLQVGERTLSIQAHPEYTRDYDKFLMESRAGRIGAERVAEGINSLDKNIDTALFRKWVTTFLESNMDC